jgi:hypothetical protein
VTQGHTHDERKESANERVSGRDNAHININRFMLPKASWEMTVIAILFLLLVISLAINGLGYARSARNDVLLRQAIDKQAQAEKDHATEIYLRRYNLDWFRAHEFAEQEVRIGVLEKLYDKCRR